MKVFTAALLAIGFMAVTSFGTLAEDLSSTVFGDFSSVVCVFKDSEK